MKHTHMKSTRTRLGASALLAIGFAASLNLMWIIWVFPSLLIPLFFKITGQTFAEASDHLALIYAFALGMIPMMAAWIPLYYLSRRLMLERSGSIATARLDELSSARASLINALSYIDFIEDDVKRRRSEFELLAKEIESMKALSAETKEEVRKKLHGLEIIDAAKSRREALKGIIIGVISSLIGSLIFLGFR